MTIIRLIFAAALSSFAVANVDEVSNDGETFAEATAFVQSFSSMHVEGDSACLKVADDAIKVIADECKALQGVIDNASKANQKCCQSGSVAACKAKNQHASFVGAHSTCLSQLDTIKKKTVNLGSVSYSSLAGKTCEGEVADHTKNSAFKAIKSEVEKKTKECYEKKGLKNAAKKTYEDAVKTAASSRTTCNANGQTALTKAFTDGKAACGSATNLKAFKRAEHMKCVLKGTKLADCSMSKPPAVKETTLSTLNCSAQTGDSCQNKQKQAHKAPTPGGESFIKGTWKGSTCKDQGVAGFRIQKEVGGGKVGYLMAKPGTAWARNKNYECPTGWHFGTSAEFSQICKGFGLHGANPEKHGNNGANQCGCSGYTCGGAYMQRFRFSDSGNPGPCLYSDMGAAKCSKAFGHSCSSKEFAGVICIKNDALMGEEGNGYGSTRRRTHHYVKGDEHGTLGHKVRAKATSKAA